jgi:hypothetical protein
VIVEIHKATPISMKHDPLFTEKQLQDLLIDDITLLGLGELDVVMKEKIQPNAGRLDLLLADHESDTRYEVELQLGATDPSHIIRTIEYWDVERRRYPQYEHIAVIVAEDITTRFLNVIGIFNGFIPLIAIQLRCYEVNGSRTLVATRILDATTLATDSEDPPGVQVDRTYWEHTASKATMELADKVLGLVKEFDPPAELKLNKYYLGLVRHGVTNNYLTFHPKKNLLTMRFKVARADDLDEHLRSSGAEFEYHPTGAWYRVRIHLDEFGDLQPVLRELCQRAVEEAIGQGT